MKRILFASIVFAAACGGGNKKQETKPEPVAEKTEPAEKPAEKPAEPAEKPAEKAAEPAPPPPPAPKHATAEMKGTAKFKKVTGKVEFKDVDGGVEVTATLEGLKKGDHGFHIHEKGDCSAPDAASAGGHFNPSNHKHGGPEAEEHHEGDLGNITADAKGKASKTFTMKGITLGDGPNSIAGKGFIVHEKADDMKTQPTGNAGGRVACGVITLDQ